MEWVKVMEELKQEFNLDLLLKCKGLARSVFYYHRMKLALVDKSASIKKEIKEIYDSNSGRYGYRRITMEMRNRGYLINHKTVQKFMQL